MERQIKFRAFAHSSNVMFYPDSEDGWEITNGIITALPNTTLMQFTGLHDKNGVEIYEGDIIKSEMTGKNVVVIYNLNFAQFVYGGCEFNVESPVKNIEVIGNVFQHTELLKKN